MGKCSEKLQHEVQKCINFAAKVASNFKYLKRDHVTPLLRDLKWINVRSILRLNEASFMYKNLYVSADSNVKKINFDLRNKVSQRITRNGSHVQLPAQFREHLLGINHYISTNIPSFH